jgi:hypothetical protein
MNARLLITLRLAAVCGLAVNLAGAATPAAGTATSAAASTAKAGATAAKPVEGKTADPFEPIRQRIDQLLKARVNPEPLPAVLPNPFTLPNSPLLLAPEDDLAPADTQAPVAAPDGPEPGSDLETLVRFAGTLKLGGLVSLNGQTSLYINQLLYKEGDVILMERRDPKSAVKVIRIAPGVLTLSFNEAKYTVRLKS